MTFSIKKQGKRFQGACFSLKQVSFRLLLTAIPCFVAATAVAQSELQALCLSSDAVAEPQATITRCSALIRSNPEQQEVLRDALHKRGIAKRQSGDMVGSIEDFERILEFDPKDTATLRMLAWTYREQGQPTKAEEMYTDILDVDPHWQGWLSRCAVRTDLEKYYLAIVDCGEVEAKVNSDPNADAGLRRSVMQDAWYFTAFSLNQVDRPALAADIARRGLDHPDINGRLYFMTLIGLWNSGQESGIDKILVEGLAKYPTDPDLLYFASEWRNR